MISAARLNYMSFVAGRSITVWLPAWLIRHGRKLDLLHTSTGVIARWAVVLLCFLAVTFVEGAPLAPLRIVLGITGLMVLCWPNLVWRFFPMPETVLQKADLR
jgi:hypothetical protein